MSVGGRPGASGAPRIRADLIGDELWVGEGRELDQPDAVRAVAQVLAKFEHQPRLAGATDSHQGHQAMRRDKLAQLRHLAQAADERRPLCRQVRQRDSREAHRREGRRCVGGVELEDRLRGVEVLEAVAPKIAEYVRGRQTIPDQRPRRLRHQHLPAVSSRRDARGSVHFRPDVAVPVRGDGSGVDPDPHPDASRGRPHDRVETGSKLGGRFDRVERVAEDDEEGVPLRPDLTPAVIREGSARDGAMSIERLRPAAAQALREAGRALDVAKEESRDPTLAARRVTHVVSWWPPSRARATGRRVAPNDGHLIGTVWDSRRKYEFGLEGRPP